VLHTVVLATVAVTLQQDAMIAAVHAAAEHEPIEVFGNAKGSVRIRDVRLLDVDGDGSPEAFVWIDPSVRQTPTILVYTYDPRTGPHRILEGLVAGQLRPVSGRFVDDHTMGFGVDLSVDRFDDGLITSAVKNELSLVRYKTFLHTDGRNGFVTFVDLSDRALPRPQTKTCEEFEFSLVEGLAAGTLSPTLQFIASTASARTGRSISGSGSRIVRLSSQDSRLQARGRSNFGRVMVPRHP